MSGLRSALGRVAHWARKSSYSWLLALLLPLFAVLPAMTVPTEEYTYDAALFHVYRGVIYSAARADGWLYPRWVQPINAGLGGPLFTFYSPLVYALLDVLHSAGLAHPLAWRALIALFLLAASVGAFGLCLALFRRADIALAGAALFSYTPYLMQEFFGRGSPQGMAIALYPWVLWALYRLAERPSGWRLLAAGVLWALVILLHNLGALLFLPLAAVFLLFLALRLGRRALWTGALALGVGLLLSAFYWLPFVALRSAVQLGNASRVAWAQPAAHPAPLADLLALPQVFDVSLGNNGVNSAAGLLQALALACGLVLGAALARQKRRAPAFLALCFSGLGLVILWLQTASATPIWAALPALNLLQFRWRLLSLIGLPAAVLLGLCIEQAPARARGALAACLIVAAIALEIPTLYPQLLLRQHRFSPAPTVAEAQSFAMSAGYPGLTTLNEFAPAWRGLPFTPAEAQQVAQSPLAYPPAGVQVLWSAQRTGYLQVTIEAPAPFRAALHVLYFPGWAGYVDGRKVTLLPAKETGYIQLDVPAGAHTVTLRYEGTPLEHAADALSLLALALLLPAVWLWRGQRAAPVAEGSYLRPRWWLPVALLALLALKTAWIDPHTTWFREQSSPTAIRGAQATADAWFGGQVRLCGYSIAPRQAHPGDRVRVTLYWQISAPPGVQLNGFAHLLGACNNPETSNPVWGQSDKQAPGDQPMRDWVPGKLYRDSYDIILPAHTPPGAYPVEVGLWQPQTGERLPVSTGGDALLLPPVSVSWPAWTPWQQRLLQILHPLRPEHARQETLGQAVRLLGYDVEPAVRPGEAIHLKLYWQALAPIAGSYTVFTHLIDAQGQSQSGHDGLPVRGARPTAGWAPGEVIVDEHDIAVPAGAPPGDYTIEVGLYNAATGVRLPAVDARGQRLEQDRIVLGPVAVGTAP